MSDDDRVAAIFHCSRHYLLGHMRSDRPTCALTFDQSFASRRALNLLSMSLIRTRDGIHRDI